MIRLFEKKVLFVLCLVLISCSAKPAPGKTVFTVAELKEDFLQVRKAGESMHPALYAFTKKETFDRLFDQQFKQINKPMGVLEFYRITAPLIARIGCGHSRLSSPEKYWDNLQKKLFPFGLQFLENKAYVMHLYEKTKTVPRGTEIITINGRPVTEITGAIKPILSADGYNNSSREYHLNRAFVFYYAVQFGFPEKFAVTYKLPGQTTKKQAVFKPVDIGRVLNYRRKRGSKKPGLHFEIKKEIGTALITIKTFSFYKNKEKFYSFIDDAFEKIYESKINHLILDFRDNSGGDPFCTTHLLSYIAERPVNYFAHVYPQYQRFARPIPLAKKRFKGNLFILINGGCFSSTGHLSALLKFHKFGTFIGQETGGTFTCNDASKMIHLKNTKLRLNMARMTFTAAAKGMPKNRGIIPDIKVVPRIEDILNGVDTQLEFTINYIKQNYSRR